MPFWQPCLLPHSCAEHPYPAQTALSSAAHAGPGAEPEQGQMHHEYHRFPWKELQKRVSYGLSTVRMVYLPSISRWISFREVALSITFSRTESCSPAMGSGLGSLAPPESGPFVEVCWRREILVLRGMPGMSFSATALRIAGLGVSYQSRPRQRHRIASELRSGWVEQHSLDFPVPLRPIRA